MTAAELPERLIELGCYMMNNGLGEIETKCGKLRIKVVVDLIKMEDCDEDSYGGLISDE